MAERQKLVEEAIPTPAKSNFLQGIFLRMSGAFRTRGEKKIPSFQSRRGFMKNAAIILGGAPVAQLVGAPSLDLQNHPQVRTQREVTYSPLANEHEGESGILDSMPEMVRSSGEQLIQEFLFEDPNGDSSNTVRNRLYMTLLVLLSVPESQDQETLDEIHSSSGLHMEGLLAATRYLVTTDIATITTDDFRLNLAWETPENPDDPLSENTELEQWASRNLTQPLMEIFDTEDAIEVAHDLAVVIAAPNTFDQLVRYCRRLGVDSHWADEIFPDLDEFRSAFYARDSTASIYDALAYFNSQREN